MSSSPQRRSRVLATYNLKGGVGKTSAAVNLTHIAALEGSSVLLWDLDPLAAVSCLLPARPKPAGARGGRLRLRREPTDPAQLTDYERLELLPASWSYPESEPPPSDRFKRPARLLERLLGPLRSRYDYIFLDCAAGSSRVSKSVLDAADALLVPVVPATLSARVYEQLEQLATDGRVGAYEDTRVLAFFSIVETGRPLHLETMGRLRRLPGVDLLGAAIPSSVDVELMGERRLPVSAFAPDGPAAVAYRALWSEIRARLADPGVGQTGAPAQ